MDEELRLILEAVGKVRDDVRDMRVVLLGVPQTEDKGIVSDIKNLNKSCESIYKELRQMNGRVSWNTARLKAVMWVIGIMAILLGLASGGTLPL